MSVGARAGYIHRLGPCRPPGSNPLTTMTSTRVLALALPLLMMASVARGAAPAEPPARFAWVGGTVIDGTSGPVLPDRVILTRGDRIEAVRAAEGFHADPDMTVIDVHGKFLIPGLVNSHVHLATSAVPDAARTYLRRELFSGVTAVRDMAGDARLLGELGREARFHEIASPDIAYSALIAGPEFFRDPRTQQASRGLTPGSAPWMQAVDGATDLPRAIARAKGSGATGVKVYADVSAPLLAAVAKEAHAQGLLVSSHAAVFPARPGDAVRAGVDVMSHACMLGYEVTDPLPALVTHPPLAVDMRRLAERGDLVDTLLAQMKAHGTLLDATLFIYFADDTGTDCTYAASADLAARAWRAGVALTAGTDDEPGDHAGPWSALLQELVLLHDGAHLPAADVIRAGTINGARAIGRDRDMGTIEAGKLANFVVLDRDPLVDLHHLETLWMTVKDGIAYRRSAF